MSTQINDLTLEIIQLRLNDSKNLRLKKHNILYSSYQNKNWQSKTTIK
jgi:hypothetical protein